MRKKGVDTKGSTSRNPSKFTVSDPLISRLSSVEIHEISDFSAETLGNDIVTIFFTKPKGEIALVLTTRCKMLLSIPDDVLRLKRG